MSLRKKTIAGLQWSALQQILTQASTLVVGILLMRMISPSEFGILAMVTVFSSFLGIFQDFGLTTSLIQKDELTNDDSQVVFWTMLLISLVLSTTLFISAGLIASFYGEEQVKPIAQVLSVTFVIGVFGSVNSALLRKELEFKKISLLRTAAVITSGLIGVFLAYLGYGVWALVTQNLSSIIMTSLLLTVIGGFRPSFNFNWNTLREHLNFGLPLFGSRSLTYFSKNSDRLLIGKFLTRSDLGIYSRAYSLLYLPIHKLSMVFTTVMFSSFSKIKTQKDKILRIYIDTTSLIVFFLAPFLTVLFLYTKEITHLLFGDEWYGINNLVKIFVFLILFHTYTLFRSNINLSQGNSMYELYFNIFGTILDVTAVVVGVFFGIQWIALNLVLSTLLKALIASHLIGKSLDYSLIQISKKLSSSLLGFIVVFCSGLMLNILFNAFDIPTAVIISMITCILIFTSVMSLYLFNNQAFTFLKSTLSLILYKPK